MPHVFSTTGLFSTTGITLCLLLTLGDLASGAHPNIVLIYGDDMGIDSVGAFNDRLGLSTPHLDRFASEGISFLDAHSTSGVCTPSRYSLLTGRYHWRSRLKRGIVNKWERPLIEPGRLTIPAMLSGLGYTTQMIGKWHLGFHWPKIGGGTTDQLDEIDFTAPIIGGPNAIGFDDWFGDDVPNWPPFAWRENDRLLGELTTTSEALGLTKYIGVRDGPAVPDWKLEDVLPEYVTRSSTFIRDQADSNKPFFLYFAMPSPHTPIAPSQQWKGKSGISDYADFLLETDWAVGEVLRAIDESGQRDETLVIFTTDNGTSPKANFQTLEANGVVLTTHWRGYKADAFEGGHRVPFIVRWPKRIKANQQSHQPITQADVMATLADVVDFQLPDNAAEDSESLYPVLSGTHDGAPLHDAIVNHSSGGYFALRQGPWKLIFCRGSGGWSAPREAVALDQGLPKIQLYNLTSDPKETENVIDQYPDRVQQMTGILRQYVENGRSTAGKRQQNHDGKTHWEPLPWTSEHHK